MAHNNKYEGFIDGAKREQELRIAEKIVNSELSDFEKATRLRRLYRDSKYFYSRYFFLLKEQNTYYCSKEESIRKIYNLILGYEKEEVEKGISLWDKVKEEDKYKLNNYTVDAREVITSYIEDFDSYKKRAFYEKHGLNYDTFRKCEASIKRNKPELYEKYLIAKNQNHTKELLMPIVKISEIREGIKCGTTSDGKPFDIYEFWKLNPFVTDDIETDIKYLSKSHPEVKKISQINRDYHAKTGQKRLGYKDYFCSFVELLGFDTDQTIRTFMEENDINTCSLFNRDKVNNNLTWYEQDGVNQEDLNYIMDYMEEENIPFVEDALRRLTSECAKQKSYSVNSRKELTMKLVREEE